MRNGPLCNNIVKQLKGDVIKTKFFLIHLYLSPNVNDASKMLLVLKLFSEESVTDIKHEYSSM